jgi:cytochrome c oxidase subunit III
MQIPYEVKPREDTGLWNAKLGIWLFLASEVMLFGGLFSAYVFLRTGSHDWPHGWLNIPVGLGNTFVLIGSSITIVLAWAALKMRDFKKYKIYMGLTILAGFMFLGVKLGYEYPQKFSHYGVELQDKTVVTGHIVNKATYKTDEYIDLEVDPPKGGHGNEHAAAPEHGAAEHGEVAGHAEGQKLGPNGHPVVRYTKDQIVRFSNWGPWYHPYLAIYFLLTALHGLHVLGGTLVNIYFWLPGSKMYFTDPEHFANRVEVSGLFWHFVDLVWIFLFPVFYLL